MSSAPHFRNHPYDAYVFLPNPTGPGPGRGGTVSERDRSGPEEDGRVTCGARLEWVGDPAGPGDEMTTTSRERMTCGR